MWPDPKSKSAALYERAQRVFVGGNTRHLVWTEPFPIYIDRGEGAYVIDVDGDRRLDFTNNLATLVHGHAHPDIMAAVADQLTRGTCFAFPTESELGLAELICERAPRIEKIRFCNTGSEAVMFAIKASRAATGRPKIAKIEGSYHGMYDYAEVSLDPTPENWGNAPRPVPYAKGTPKGVLDDVVVLPMNDIEGAERLVRDQAHNLAAVLVDPVPSSCGLVPLTPEYIAFLREFTRRIGARLIFDEVIAARYAYNFAHGRFGGDPDLVTMGKIIGGGFAVGAVGGTDEAMAVFEHRSGKPLMPASGTFTANPVTMVAGLASMRMLTPEAFDRLEALGDRLRERVRAGFERIGFPGQINGVGSAFQIALHNRPITDYRSAWKRPDERAGVKALQRWLLEHGYVVSYGGGGFLSTVMTEAEIDGFADAVCEAVQTLPTIESAAA